jgi:hypothetical protein
MIKHRVLSPDNRCDLIFRRIRFQGKAVAVQRER